jgi:hypothetical protein
MIEWKYLVTFSEVGKPRKCPNSYRPISISNHLIKLLERIINIRLNVFLASSNSISYLQSGFREYPRASLSTKTQLTYRKPLDRTAISCIPKQIIIANDNILLPIRNTLRSNFFWKIVFYKERRLERIKGI